MFGSNRRAIVSTVSCFCNYTHFRSLIAQSECVGNLNPGVASPLQTSFLEGELRQERQRYTALEQRVMVWENQLVDLISMADNEWAVNDSLHVRFFNPFWDRIANPCVYPVVPVYSCSQF